MYRGDEGVLLGFVVLVGMEEQEGVGSESVKHCVLSFVYVLCFGVLEANAMNV